MKNFLKILMTACLLHGSAAIAQIGVLTDFPHASAIMDMNSTTKGLLIPRVTLTSNLANPSPVSSPATGLLVFNSGANQPLGFYFWNGSQWVAVAGTGGGSTNYWSLTGNAGTTPGTNFIGTTDGQDFVVYTNSTERMRFESDGRAVIGASSPYNIEDLFTAIGNSGQNYAINAYSPYVGVYSTGNYSGFRCEGGKYGLLSSIDSINGFAVYARNQRASGYGMMAIGNNVDPSYLIGRAAGLASNGPDGLFCMGHFTNGSGVIGLGSNGDTAYSTTVGSGGAFTGYHGVYARARVTQGTGIAASGNNVSPMLRTGGSGGAFTGTTTGVAGYGTGSTGNGGFFEGADGIYAKATSASAGMGIIAAGNNGSVTPLATGGGGTFTGYHGVLGKATNTNGLGVIGIGGGVSGFPSVSNGCGGVFTGFQGVYGLGTNAAAGTGVLGAGNNLAYVLYSTVGSGGAFTGVSAGVVGWGENVTTGTGVIGAGNDVAATVSATGSGGAFTGTTCGVYGNATSASGTRYGGYFATTNGQYAYVGGRVNNVNKKIVGTGDVSTIVKNTSGDLITLTCPEAPESLFQDFGIGQLVNGMAHITIDPDLAININVSEDHPLKVYITPEGDCKGVYVTNKSAQGFDVIELQGGQSNIPFAWQIVATRANEQYVLKDGSIEISDYSQRFPPAPGPLEMIEQPAQKIQTKMTYPSERTDTGSEKIEENIFQVTEAEAVETGRNKSE